MPDGCAKFCYNGSYNMGTKSAEFYLKHQFQVPSNVVSIDTDQSGLLKLGQEIASEFPVSLMLFLFWSLELTWS